MTTCRTIITRGLQQAGVIPADETPESHEAEIGLDVLQSLYRTWFSSGEFGYFRDVYKDTDYDAEEQDRVTAEAGVTITLPTTYSITNGECGDGTGTRRAPYELAAIEVIQGDVKSYIWERTGWVEINALTLDSVAPLEHYGKMGLSACFAMHFVETFGGQIGGGTKQLADRFIVAMRSRRIDANPTATTVYF